MGLTNVERAALTGAGFPAYATIERWCDLSGIGRRVTYDMLAEGKLRAIKNGRRTLIDVVHALAYLASLPPAQVRPQHRRVHRQGETIAAR